MDRRTAYLQSCLLACCFAIALTEKNVKVSTQNDYTIEIVTAPIAHGEGPHWDNKSQALYFVNIEGQDVVRKDFNTGILTRAHLNYGPVSVVVPVRDRPDKLLVACRQEILLVTWDGKQNMTDPPFKILSVLEHPQQNTRVNDGKCDKLNRFWIGTMGKQNSKGDVKPKQGSLYSYDGGKVKKKISPVSISNGVVWNSRSDIMYYIDTLTKTVVSYDYNLRYGRLRNKKVVFDLQKHNITGLPDGMTIDSQDNIWVAVFNGYSVLHINPRSGELLKQVKLPARQISSVAFGGPLLDTLFVTSVNYDLKSDEKQRLPYSGCTFAVRNLGVTGVLMNDFEFKD